jgi:hypothetical protein
MKLYALKKTLNGEQVSVVRIIYDSPLMMLKLDKVLEFLQLEKEELDPDVFGTPLNLAEQLLQNHGYESFDKCFPDWKPFVVDTETLDIPAPTKVKTQRPEHGVAETVPANSSGIHPLYSTEFKRSWKKAGSHIPADQLTHIEFVPASHPEIDEVRDKVMDEFKKKFPHVGAIIDGMERYKKPEFVDGAYLLAERTPMTKERKQLIDQTIKELHAMATDPNAPRMEIKPVKECAYSNSCPASTAEEDEKDNYEEMKKRGWGHFGSPFEIQALDISDRFKGPDRDEQAAKAHREECGCGWPDHDYHYTLNRWLESIQEIYLDEKVPDYINEIIELCDNRGQDFFENIRKGHLINAVTRALDKSPFGSKEKAHLLDIMKVTKELTNKVYKGELTSDAFGYVDDWVTCVKCKKPFLAIHEGDNICSKCSPTFPGGKK